MMAASVSCPAQTGAHCVAPAADACRRAWRELRLEGPGEVTPRPPAMRSLLDDGAGAGRVRLRDEEAALGLAPEKPNEVEAAASGTAPVAPGGEAHGDPLGLEQAAHACRVLPTPDLDPASIIG